MADVALISVITSGIVGVGGLSLGAWNARAERASRREDREHARKVARDQRIDERRAEMYVDMLAFLERNLSTYERIYPASLGPPLEPPPALSDDEWMQTKARIYAFGSDEVVALVEEFEKISVQFIEGWMACATLEQAAAKGTDFETNFYKLDKARKKLRHEALPKIERRVREELSAP